MRSNFLLLFGILILFSLHSHTGFGQKKQSSFANYDASGKKIDISYVIIKGDEKSYQFEMDSLSADFRSLSEIDPNWIKSIEILKYKPLEGDTKNGMIMTLKKRKLNKLPSDMKRKFH
jgi:hypothetical protein